MLYHFQAHDLQPRDFSGTADPYAKIRLLPDASKTNMWQTRIHKRTLNPGKTFIIWLKALPMTQFSYSFRRRFCF